MSSEAADLYTEMVTHGFSLAVSGDKLVVSPSDRLTDPLRQRIRANKPALMGILAPDRPPMRVYRVQLAMPPKDPRAARWVSMLAPGADLSEATRSAQSWFGTERVLNVVESRH